MARFSNNKKASIFIFLLLIYSKTKSQIEVAHATVKDFKKTGLGGFLNFIQPINNANYLTLEGGLQYFKNEYEEELTLIPVGLGYLYTLNQNGYGLYIDPKLGYTFGSSTIGIYEDPGTPIAGKNGEWAYEKVAGFMSGIGVGYLLEPINKLQLNFSIRYEHTFANASVNIFSIRLTQSFYFGKKR